MHIRTRKKQLSAACHYAYTRLALNYYMYYEISMEESFLSRRLAPLDAGFHGLLRGFLEGEFDVKALDGLRNQVKAEVEIITAYTDSFQAHEYVLNRLEGNFSPQLMGKRPAISGEAAMTTWIMSYITDTGEAAVVNERIRSVLGQLPVRFTKEKFFELVEKGLSAYKGGTRESLENMLYILRCESLLNRPGDMADGYGPLHSVLEELERAGYQNMTSESYRYLSEGLKRAGQLLMDETGQLMLLMDLVNDLYVLFLTRNLAMMEVSEERRLKDIFCAILALFRNGENVPIPEEVTEKLSKLEGKQETYCEQWMNASLPEGEGKEPSQGDLEASILYQVELLLSGSAFMSLGEPGPDAEAVVDQAMLKAETDRFFGEFSQAFKGQSRLLVRAVMAKVLSSLPVFFESLGQVQEYVESSLSSCTDDIEKAVALKMIEELMIEDGFGLEYTP